MSMGAGAVQLSTQGLSRKTQSIRCYALANIAFCLDVRRAKAPGIVLKCAPSRSIIQSTHGLYLLITTHATFSASVSPCQNYKYPQVKS